MAIDKNLQIVNSSNSIISNGLSSEPISTSDKCDIDLISPSASSSKLNKTAPLTSTSLRGHNRFHSHGHINEKANHLNGYVLTSEAKTSLNKQASIHFFSFFNNHG
jgi:hypothetical protein